MTPETDTNSPPETAAHREDFEAEPPPPTNWREALLTLIASRVSILQIESKEAAQAVAERAVRLVAMVICIFFTWALFLAGGIAAISTATGWPWFWIAIAVAGIHLLAALWLAKTAKAPAPPTFTASRAEFKKDREWIENFQKTRKSDD